MTKRYFHDEPSFRSARLESGLRMPDSESQATAWFLDSFKVDRCRKQLGLVSFGPTASRSDVDFERHVKFVRLLHTLTHNIDDVVDFIGGSFEK